MRFVKLLAIIIYSGCLLNTAFASTNTDARVLYALDLGQRGMHEKAAEEMLELYKTTNSKLYLKNALLLYSFSTNTNKFNQLLNRYENTLKDDIEYKRLRSLLYIRDNKLEKAKQLMIKIVDQTNSPDDMKVLAQIELLSGNNNKAYEILLKLYKADKSEENMLMLAQAFSMGLKKILPYIDEIYKNYNCQNEQICILMAEGYLKAQKSTEAMKIYDTVFSHSGTLGLDVALTNLVQNGLYEEALTLVDKFDPENLQTKAEIYAILNRPKEASDTYHELFKRSKDPVHLTLEATYEYEAKKSTIKKKELSLINDKFKQAIQMGVTGDEILNNYGYFLIDSDLDVKNGIEMVRQALAQSPQNTYYLDSLAWGYFKLGDCKKAQELMQEAIKISNKIISIIYVKEHIEAIKNCYKKEDK